MREAAAQAEKIGLAGLCFTDHCDFFVPKEKAAHENERPEVFDVASQQMLLAQIGKWKQEGRCILYAGHDPEELRAVCDRLVLMNGEHTTVLDPGEVEDLPALLRSATQ